MRLDQAELAAYVLHTYRAEIEAAMDQLDPPVTENALAATQRGLRKAIELAREAREPQPKRKRARKETK